MKNYESGLQRAYGSYKYLHQPCVGPLVLQASGLQRAFAVISNRAYRGLTAATNIFINPA